MNQIEDQSPGRIATGMARLTHVHPTWFYSMVPRDCSMSAFPPTKPVMTAPKLALLALGLAVAALIVLAFNRRSAEAQPTVVVGNGAAEVAQAADLAQAQEAQPERSGVVGVDHTDDVGSPDSVTVQPAVEQRRLERARRAVTYWAGMAPPMFNLN